MNASECECDPFEKHLKIIREIPEKKFVEQIEKRKK